jgi:hypothetical protein
MAAEHEIPKDCRTAKDVLQEVNAEIARYNVKNLPDLQKELDGFVKAQDGLVSDYRSKFPDLRKKWCARQVDVERLCAHVRCEFPLKEEKWREHVEKCICKPIHDLCCLRKRIARRKYCCAGPHEHKRDQAQAAYDKAKAHLDWMKALPQKLDDALAANLDLVNQINAVPPDQRPTVLYLFFLLRQSHCQMAPYDASEDCREVCSEYDPNRLCHEVFERECKEKEEECHCHPKGEWPDVDCTCVAKIDAPWLMSPDKYCHALDCAWDAYYNAKLELGKAEAELKRHPDDLSSLQAQYDADSAGIKDKILNCLKQIHCPTENCCHDHEPRREGERRRDEEYRRDDERRGNEEYRRDDERRREDERRRDHETRKGGC